MLRSTIQQFREKKLKGQKLTLITAYDYTFGRIVDEAGFDG
ncbi:MAG: 3-methyl-2-oxobutanoate hydroxymethyltransferase, partial [Nitrospirae bacterium]|nr:3-methyl-2-oxobutanoate hydroxymethyltransferase [Nitrospirota bacterium]